MITNIQVLSLTKGGTVIGNPTRENVPITKGKTYTVIGIQKSKYTRKNSRYIGIMSDKGVVAYFAPKHFDLP